VTETLPTFFVVGAAKAGTTSLYHYLGQHPQVFTSPVKEPNFFSHGMSGRDPVGPGEVVVRDWDHYLDLFSAVRDERAIGEASISYLPDPDAPKRIREHVPGARIIAILRDPIERAFTYFQMFQRLGMEDSCDFLAAVAAERGADWNGSYLNRYAPQLERYIKVFPPTQIQIHLYDDLRADPRAVVRRIFSFLGVDDGFEPDTARRHNVGGLPRRPRLQAFLDDLPGPIRSGLEAVVPQATRARVYWKLREWNLQSKPLLPPEARRRLLPLVRDDILAVQQLIGRDLSAWLAES
jgi:hypothetical protein